MFFSFGQVFNWIVFTACCLFASQACLADTGLRAPQASARELLPYLMAAGEWQLSRDFDKGYSVMPGVKAGAYIYPGNVPGQLQLEYARTEAVSGFELMSRQLSTGRSISPSIMH